NFQHIAAELIAPEKDDDAVTDRCTIRFNYEYSSLIRMCSQLRERQAEIRFDWMCSRIILVQIVHELLNAIHVLGGTQAKRQLTHRLFLLLPDKSTRAEDLLVAAGGSRTLHDDERRLQQVIGNSASLRSTRLHQLLQRKDRPQGLRNEELTCECAHAVAD